jgi:transposase-like protein
VYSATIRTENMMEKANKELKRRKKELGAFPE